MRINSALSYVATGVTLLGICAVPCHAATTYTDRNAFDATASTYDIADFTGLAGTGCNAFEIFRGSTVAPGP